MMVGVCWFFYKVTHHQHTPFVPRSSRSSQPWVQRIPQTVAQEVKS